MINRTEEIKERLSKISKGEWHAEHGRDGSQVYATIPPDHNMVNAHAREDDIGGGNWSGEGGGYYMETEDAEFIAHAPEDIKFLLAELEKTKKQLQGERYAKG